MPAHPPETREKPAMKLCRYGKNGYEKPGMIDSKGQLRDLSGHIANIDQFTISRKGLAELRKINPESLPIVRGKPRFGVPYTGISKFVAIGLNYVAHAHEANQPIPAEPVIFMKTTTSIMGPNDDIVTPRGSTKLDYEVELGIVIGTKASYVSEADALKYVAGYAVVNDVSERAFQLQSTQWDKGKGFDTSGPIGPWLVTTDEMRDPQTMDIWLDVNGERRQSSNTSDMIFTCAKLVSYCSQFMTLMPGDIITTGTPSGVALGIKDRNAFLKTGDVVTLGISGLGEQRQVVKPAR
jgi:2-keto-4-pentenoate hydratase/2-oxohepta-3-ene-1,7-dioic acid hydratase in catechol pathway